VRHRTWVRLDNASNVFLAAMSDVDTKVFRLSAELDADVDPALLQEALDHVYAEYVLYHSVLRRGVFWYYLEESDLRPTVVPDVLPPCAPVYHFDRRELLFRVAHRGNRVILEVFHALSDATGALWLFQDLLAEYVRLRHPDDDADAVARGPGGVKHGLERDCFGHHFHPGSRDFATAATSASVRAADAAARRAEREHDSRVIGSVRRSGRRRVLRVRGTPTPDNRTRLVELSMPVGPVLALAKSEGVSLTVYLTALFLEAVRGAGLDRLDRRGGLDRRPSTLAVSVPVNLRQFFPSDSARNFFATTRLEFTYGEGDDSVHAVCAALDRQLRRQTTPETLCAKLRKLIGFELNPAIRVIPRPLKDLILGAVNRLNNRTLTVAISNLGRVELPPSAGDHVGAIHFAVSAARPQFCCVTHAGVLTLSFTSPFSDTRHHALFVRALTERGVPVTVAATRVTRAELEDAGPAMPFQESRR